MAQWVASAQLPVQQFENNHHTTISKSAFQTIKQKKPKPVF